MANICMILGKSGSGKSTSIKTLDPKETVVFNVLKKRLPFKGSKGVYNTENKNLFNVDDYATIVTYLTGINDKMPNIKTVIIDDATYVMRKEYFKTAKISGYNKYTDMAAHFQSIISTAENLRDDLNVFLIMHSEEIVSDGTIIGYKPSTVGKLIDNSYNPVEVVPMVLFSSVKYDDKGNASYGFYTHRCMEGNTEIPAKSPDEMFTENFIPNDLGYVVKAMNEYYN
nr:MAG TPA: AAA domain protein [Crassvirales sp.]